MLIDLFMSWYRRRERKPWLVIGFLNYYISLIYDNGIHSIPDILRSLVFQEKKKNAQENNSKDGNAESKEEAKDEEVINLRALNMEDMKWAKSQVM